VIFFLSFFAFSLRISAPTALDISTLLQNAQQLNAELGNRKIKGAVMISDDTTYTNGLMGQHSTGA